MGLSRYPLGGAEAHATKLSRISRLASMAGYEHLSKHKALLDDGIMKLLPDEIRSSELSRNTAIDKKWANSSGFGKKRTAFGNVRLVPMDTLTRAKCAQHFSIPLNIVYCSEADQTNIIFGSRNLKVFDETLELLKMR